MEVLGINIGSQGIKGAVVDTKEGKIISDCKSTPPLEDTAPHKVLAQVHQLVKNDFDWEGTVGCAFPASVRNGNILSAQHIDNSWVDANAEQLLSDITDNPVVVVNDTDAMGLAEMVYGAGQNQQGLAIVLSVCSTFGSSLFLGNRLVPNTELGYIKIDDQTVQKYASDETHQDKQPSKKNRANKLQNILDHFEKIFHPNLFILGGDLVQKADQIFPFIKINTTFKAASFQEDAGITGAAMVAANHKD